MRQSLCLFGVFLLFASNPLFAEDPEAGSRTTGSQTAEGQTASSSQPAESHAANSRTVIRGRAVLLDINARVIEQNQVVVWDESHQRPTLSGSPVSIKMVGSNVAVMIQFTPYLRRDGQNILAAQGQVWLEIPGQGVRYQSTMQTIPIDFDEPIYFFPLGTAQNGNTAHIEIVLTMKAYTEAEKPEN